MLERNRNRLVAIAGIVILALATWVGCDRVAGVAPADPGPTPKASPQPDDFWEQLFPSATPCAETNLLKVASTYIPGPDGKNHPTFMVVPTCKGLVAGYNLGDAVGALATIVDMPDTAACGLAMITDPNTKEVWDTESFHGGDSSQVQIKHVNGEALYAVAPISPTCGTDKLN